MSIKKILEDQASYFLNGLAFVGGAILTMKEFIFEGGTKPVSDGTIPKLKPQPEIPDNDPIKTPIVDPINRIKPVPDPIYKDPFLPVIPDYEIIYPDLPDEIYPEPPPPNADLNNKEYVVTIKYNLKNRVFGCLLQKPFYNIDQEYCSYIDETPQIFWSNIFQENLDKINEYINDPENAMFENASESMLVFFILPFFSSPIPILGSDTLQKISNYITKRNYFVDNYDSSGLINTGEISIKQCPLETEQSPSYEVLTNNDNFVGIPIYSHDDPKGYKVDQLHVFYVNYDSGKKEERYFILPLPKNLDEITKDLLKQTLPEFLDFGNVQYILKWKVPEQDGFKQLAETSFFGNETEKEKQKEKIDEIKGWVEALCLPELELKHWYVKEFNDTIKKKPEKTYQLYNCKVLGWSEEDGKKTWILKATWNFST